jgi:cellulose synthase/poly-beta-1,6-N-acetylglucosamine synthase-like glycosyltransferase
MVATNPAVTVVIPLYNKREFVVEAVKSVFAYQGQLDVVVVDDGSTDGGADLVEQRFGPRTRMIRQPNQGVSAARNTGILASTAELIAFLDADDYWLPGHLESLLPLVAEYPDATIFADRCSTTATPSREAQTYVPRLLDFEVYVFGVSHGRFPVHSSTALVRRSRLIEVGMFPEGQHLGEDQATWLRLARLGPVVTLPRTGAVYRQVPGSLVSQLTVRPSAAIRAARTILKNEVLSPSTRRALTAYRDSFAVNQAGLALRHLRPGTARRLLRMCDTPARLRARWWKLWLTSHLPAKLISRVVHARRAAP